MKEAKQGGATIGALFPEFKPKPKPSPRTPTPRKPRPPQILNDPSPHPVLDEEWRPRPVMRYGYLMHVHNGRLVTLGDELELLYVNQHAEKNDIALENEYVIQLPMGLPPLHIVVSETIYSEARAAQVIMRQRQRLETLAKPKRRRLKEKRKPNRPPYRKHAKRITNADLPPVEEWVASLKLPKIKKENPEDADSG